LKGGLGAGIGAQLSKGSALKATTVVYSNEVCSNFTAMSSRTLLSDHVCGEFELEEALGLSWDRLLNELVTNKLSPTQITAKVNYNFS
jgi:hypothetical protein